MPAPFATFVFVTALLAASPALAMAEKAPEAESSAAPAASTAAQPAAKTETVTNPRAALVLQVQDHDKTLGDADAPITIVEYASMTCSHCADFHTGQLQKLKADYVETGKVQFVLRDMPWDAVALAVSKITRCAPGDKYFAFVDTYMETQKDWVQSENPLAAVKQVARMGGMDDAAVTACLEDADLHQQIMTTAMAAQEVLGVQGTPTLFINGEKLGGAAPYDVLKAVIERQLAEAE